MANVPDVKGAAQAVKSKASTVGGITLQYWIILEGIKAALGVADDASVRFLGTHLGGNETTLVNGMLLFGTLYVLHALGITVMQQADPIVVQTEPTVVQQGDTIIQTPVVNHNYQVHQDVAAPTAPVAATTGGQ